MPTKEEVARVVKHLQEKWGMRGCPMCTAATWQVSDSVFQLLEYKAEGLVLGGPIIPVIPVTCGNCGNTVMVNAIVAKVIPVGVQEPPARAAAAGLGRSEDKK